jgi:DHA2 family multidrug resistance protein-like MFS transporter
MSSQPTGRHIDMSANEAPRAGRREWIGLAVIALPCLLYAMDLTVLNLAVPELSEDLQPTSVQLLWILDIYGFLVAGSLITMGTLGDRIGRRRLLLIGAAAFGAASVVAAFSTSAEMLIASRALLGIAGATVAPSTLSLIRNMFHDPRQRTFAIGVWITSYSAGGAIGPLLGGVMLEFFWWGSVFLLAVPVMVLLLILGPILLPEFRDPDAGRLDLFSAALSLVSVLAVIYGLKQIVQDGVGWLPVLSIVVGLAVGLAFLRRQTKLADPLIDLRLFRVPAFSASLAVYTLGILILFGAFLFIFQYLQLVLDLSPFEAGLWTLPAFGGFIVGSMLAPLIVRRTRPAYVMAAGLALGAVGFGLLTQVDGESGLAVIVSASLIFSLGLAPLFTLTNDLILGAAPPERAGAASAISETGAELGGALSIAILGSIGTAVYRSQMADGVPVGVPSEEAETARDTLGGAVAAADELNGPLATELLDVAREAFTQGMQVAALTSAVAAALTAVLAALLLRRVRAGSEHETPSQLGPSGAPVRAAAVEPE